jgi:hypothetical protein
MAHPGAVRVELEGEAAAADDVVGDDDGDLDAEKVVATRASRAESRVGEDVVVAACEAEGR